MAKDKTSKRPITSPKRTATAAAGDKVKQSTAKDFMPKTMDLGGGLVISGKLRLGGMQYLEDKYDCSISDIPFQNGRIGPVSDLLVAIVLGDKPDTPVDEIIKLVSGVEVAQLRKVTSQLTAAITTTSSKVPTKKKANTVTI